MNRGPVLLHLAGMIRGSTKVRGLASTRILKPGKEFEGDFLRDAVAQMSDNRYQYNLNPTRATYTRGGGRDIIGTFTCNNHKKPHTWPSGVIYTELYLASDGYYRAILHSQQCRLCEEYVQPEVNKENYAEKTVSAFDLWTGRRARQEPTPFFKTAPHDDKRCHACQNGMCHRAHFDKGLL